MKYNSTKITEEQFHSLLQKKRKLVLYEDKVLDLGSFINEHPGGSGAIMRNIGHQISRAITQQYSHRQPAAVIKKLMTYQIGVICKSTEPTKSPARKQKNSKSIARKSPTPHNIKISVIQVQSCIWSSELDENKPPIDIRSTPMTPSYSIRHPSFNN